MLRLLPLAKPIVLKVPVSVGELLDKVSILRIKAERIDDPEKLAAVGLELSHLSALLPSGAGPWVQRLEEINGKLWDIEDALRAKEREQDFGSEFVSLARAVYFTNDQRAELKWEINAHYGSELVEVKSYEAYAKPRLTGGCDAATETVKNPLIVKDKEERAKAQAVVDGAPEEVKTFAGEQA